MYVYLRTHLVSRLYCDITGCIRRHMMYGDGRYMTICDSLLILFNVHRVAKFVGGTIQTAYCAENEGRLGDALAPGSWDANPCCHEYQAAHMELYSNLGRK